MTLVAIGDGQVGDGAPAFILAEVASAHQGDPDQVLALGRAAKKAGANGIKLQLFRSSELLAPNDPRMETFHRIELSIADWERLLDEISALGLPLLADVFDRPSLALAEAHGVEAYKIHSTDMEHPEFIKEVAATGKTLLLSTGGCHRDDVEKALNVARLEGNARIILLHGIQNFPTRVEDSHLRYIRTLKSAFGCPVGFLDHIDGGTLMAKLLPALARAFGADLVEKHMILDRSAKGFDYESALDPEPFAEMVTLIREAEKSFGEDQLPRQESAEHYHRLMRRAVLSRETLPRGEPVGKDQLLLVRNEKGLAPKDSGRLIGRKPKRDIPAWQPLTEDLFE